MSASIVVCESCCSWPATRDRQRLVVTTGANGKPWGTAVPVPVCDRCAEAWPTFAGHAHGPVVAE